MTQWLAFALTTFVLWGMWGIFSKLATQSLNPQSVLVYQAVPFLLVAFIPLLFGSKFQWNAKGVVFALLAGLCLGLGDVFYFYALEKGKVSIVFTIAALYPVVTIILAFLVLNETITLTQAAGILLGLIAMYLLAA